LFKRLHGPERRYEGTGLGAICHDIVERYGERIRI
jgi:light-regulated signal transduction histidine kinase (bacteriophytochrome)